MRSRFVGFKLWKFLVAEYFDPLQARQKDAGDDEIQGVDETFIDA